MITVTDLFCGAGGSALGAVAVPSVQLVMAANHWERAVATHAANFPSVAHDIADISQVEPRRYPRTTVLWASPECTNHSQAQGRKRDAAQPDLFGEVLPDAAAERSRATMWDVPRFTEYHDYPCVIVENVVDAMKWRGWRGWLTVMADLGYRHQVVHLNSMHAPAMATLRAPQSRDRIYVVFTKVGNPAPDLAVRPVAHCLACGRDVESVQTWKRVDRPAWGRYRAQYVYRCSTSGCHKLVEPYVLPAAEAIDWSLAGQRIGDRNKPLRPATIARIEAGLARYAVAPQLVPAGGGWNLAPSPVTEPMRTRTTRETEALLIPVEGRDGKTAQPTRAPLRTQTARAETALVVPYYGADASAGTAAAPLRALTTRDRFGLAFIAELRGGGCKTKTRDVTEPISTVCANGQHHMLVRNNGSSPEAGPMCTPIDEPARTLTTAGHQSVVDWPQPHPAVEDCTFRMLEPGEIQRAMAFTPGYAVHGNRRERVRQLGNGVTPPAAEFLFTRVVATLTRSR